MVALLGTILAMVLTFSSHANGIPADIVDNSLTSDTTGPLRAIRVNVKDTAKPRLTTDSTRRDTVPRLQRADTFSLKISKDTLSAPVHYEAEDSAVIYVPNKQIVLYGKTKTVYNDVTLTAPRVSLDQKTSILTAYNVKDSTGEVVTRAKFEQKENNFESDTIFYNFKTQKGITRNTFTQQQEMFIQGTRIKKVDSSVFVENGRFTTCNLEEPHFNFRAGKLKVISNRVAVSGPMHPEFEGVPVPIYLPFGYYPLTKTRHSGFLAPQVTATENYGIGLEGLGYYKTFNDYTDLTVRTNIYSYGGWRLDLAPSYRVRYRYNGAMNLSLQNTKINFRGDPDYQQTTTFNIAWHHTMDMKARPGVSFNARVEAGSTKFNRYVTNNALDPFRNQLNSSIAFQRVWEKSTLQLNANHSQNSFDRLVNIELPSASFSLNPFYPFRPKDAAGASTWYEKLGIGYSGTLKNSTAFYDSAFSFKHALDTMQAGIAHTLPITLALPSTGPLLISPAFNYSENWMTRKTFLAWDPNKKKLDTTEARGFYTARNISMGIGVNTALFGTFQFRNKNIVALRHTLRPTFGLQYSPSLAKKYHQRVQADSTGKYFIERSFYDIGNIFRGFSNTTFGGINFGLDNRLEMKLRNRKDTSKGATRNVSIIDAFSITGGYNFLADSLRLTDLSLSLRSTLMDKINLNIGAALSPYKVNEFSQPINNFVWEDGFRPGRITYANIALSTQFKSKPRDPAKGEQPQQTGNNRITDPTLLADQARLQEYMRRNPTEFVDFNVPYDLSLNVAVTISRLFDRNTQTFKSVVNSSATFNNSFSLTPKWNISSNGIFDISAMKLSMFSMAINREMHCWQLSIAVAPIGIQRYFNISLSPKSSLLQNLKVNRTRQFNSF